MTTDAPQPPVTKYELTLRIRGNSHDEIEAELLTLTRGGYLLDSDYHRRDEFDCTDGRVTARLVHANPEQTPEQYREQLDEWWQARRATRGDGSTARVSPVIEGGESA